MKKIETRSLVEMLLGKAGHTIEASLNDGSFNATHLLTFEGRKIFDCGIDSAEVSWDIEVFSAFYSQAHWRVDQLV